ncbi:hypothetical protein Y1Q_0017470 [Alligator mississippiensis]|uniref:Reverse transcriptase/retrotransposon-derived protein RNase H-like domain-containing protein n=1 Tax=Alligator mississippiensis TaxID=8496 RepID=A0A151P324_ALLMI|nr:hypothetical protein Y1Q_0017470 [Alligator mississippiensis]
MPRQISDFHVKKTEKEKVEHKIKQLVKISNNNQYAMVITVYTPTPGNEEVPKEQFYCTLDIVLTAALKEDKLVLMGNGPEEGDGEDGRPSPNRKRVVTTSKAQNAGFAPLTEVLKGWRAGPIKWTAKMMRNFELLKKAFCEDIMIYTSDFCKPFILQTDVLETTIGAVLT